VRSLAGSNGSTKGVDSVYESVDAIAAGQWLAKEYGCTVSISGRTDFIVDATGRIGIQNGSDLMPSVTGMGCTASALTGAFSAINSSPFHAAAHAMALMGVAGELAARKCFGPGTFVPHFLDTLHSLDEATLIALVNPTAD
jgi:hydroxyethylthiazole kinase